MKATLTRTEILEALQDVNNILQQKEIRGEICVFGGTAMILAFDARESTRDVDAVFRPAQEIREAARQVAATNGLEDHWLNNDGVKGFLSSEGEFQALKLPEYSHLQIIAPTPEYLLAMKCMAARTPGYETSGDKEDVKFLLHHLRIDTANQALTIVEKYYGDQPIHVKTRFFVEEISEELAKKKNHA